MFLDKTLSSQKNIDGYLGKNINRSRRAERFSRWRWINWGADNVLVGSDSDVTIAVDINGATDLGSSVASGDLLLVADIDDSNNIKKTSVADIVGAVSSGVTSAKLTGDTGNTGADTGAVNHTIAGGNGIITSLVVIHLQ